MPGTDAGTVSRRQRTVASATSCTLACSGQALPGRTMFGLSSMPSGRTRCRRSAANTRGQRRGGHLVAALDRVVAVHQHLGLDDRDEPGLLRQRGEAGERLGVGVDAALGRDPVADGDDRPPLGEARAEVAVLGQAVAQAVQALGDLLAVEPGQRLGALVDLDPRDDPLGAEHLGERGAVGRPLADGLVEQDHAADELAQPVGGEQQLAVGAAVLLGRLDTRWT